MADAIQTGAAPIGQVGLTSAVPQERPKRRRWTRKEVYRLLELGFFNEQRVELIGGQTFIMPPQLNYHAVGIGLTEDALRATFGPGFWIRVQMSMNLRPHSIPDPDLAVVPGTPRTANPAKNPTSALLVVEVSHTTLHWYRRVKDSLYARAGIADYWILNLVDRQLEVYRNPVPDAARLFGFAYADVTILSAAEVATPLAAPQARIPVADLLP